MVGLTDEVLAEAELSLEEHGYTMCDFVGSGGFGAVYTVKSAQYDQLFCAKILPRVDCRPSSEKTFSAEFNSLIGLNHPSIVRLYAVWSTLQCNFLILEYISGGSMSELIRTRRLDEDTIRTYGTQLLNGLVFCHNKGICHGDIKPANILIDELGRARLADFGLSGTVAELTTEFAHCRGSLAYLPPERFLGTAMDPRATDVWAFGLTLYEMAIGQLPWTMTTVEDVVAQIRTGLVVYPPRLNIELRQVLMKMLARLEKDRPTMQEILNLPFFAGRNGVASPATIVSSQRMFPTAHTLIVPKLTALGKGSFRLPYPSGTVVVLRRRKIGSVGPPTLPPVEQLRAPRISSEA
jgi:serine/threonine protein kinase